MAALAGDLSLPGLQRNHALALPGNELPPGALFDCRDRCYVATNGAWPGGERCERRSMNLAIGAGGRISFDEYLERRFNLDATHGISPAQAQKVFGNINPERRASDV